MESNRAFTFRRQTRLSHGILGTLAFITACAPVLVLAQYSEIKMGEYLHYAVAAANGGVYAGIDGIGYTTVFGTPSLYQTNTGWVDLPSSLGFDTSRQYYGQPKGISHDGSVIAGYMVGVPTTATNGISIQVAAYWVSGVESLVPAPPDDPSPTLMSATGVSGDGTTLIVQDQTSTKTESYVFNIASSAFTSLGFPVSSNQQTYATAINNHGSIVTGYYNLDNGIIHGFIWDATNGLRDIGIPDSHPNTYYLEPTCISDDGTTVFGQLTEFNGWLGFRYNTTTGFEDLGGITPSACTADGTEAVGIENMYFPAIWSVGNGGGYLDHLLTANGTTQALGTIEGPVTISPDGSAITALGPDAYLTDQIWYGTWQILLPVPLKAAPIPLATQTFSTAYQTTLTVPAGTLTQYADFNNGVSAKLVKGPHYASAFVLNADGSFSYTPQPGYISNGIDPETGTPTDTFTYQLVSPNGTSTNAQVQINVLAPMAPTVDTPTAANVTTTTATLGGNVSSDGGATITSIGVVYAPTLVDSAPQVGDSGVSIVTGTGTTGAFTVDVSGLTPGTDYSYAAYASNSIGISYSQVGGFTSLATPVVLPAQSDIAATDLVTLTVTNTATDPNGGNDTLSYQLLNPPAGAAIDSNGIITWTPNLEQSPSTNLIVTVVTATIVNLSGWTTLSTTNSFVVTVTGPYDGLDMMVDSDGDGLTNLLECVVGGDPLNPADGNNNIIINITQDSGNHYLAMQYKARINAAALQWQYLPEVSEDKVVWYSDTNHVMGLSVTPVDAQFNWTSVRDTTPITSSEARFQRLHIIAGTNETFSPIWIGSDTLLQGTNLTLFSKRMIRPILDAGIVVSVNSSTITRTNAGFVAGQFGTNGMPAYAEFDNGTRIDIANSTTNGLVLVSSAASASVGDAFRIRAHFTVASLFGTNNEAGLVAGSNPAQADNVLLFMPRAQQTLTLFYYSNPSFTTWRGWVRADTFAPDPNEVIYPEQGVMVSRLSPSDANLYLWGPIQTGVARAMIQPGYNLVGALNSSTAITLSNLDLYTGDSGSGIVGGLNPSVVDNLIMVNQDGSVRTFFYYDNPAVYQGWVNASGYTLSGGVQIPPGSAFFVNRQTPGAFTWTIPAE